MLLLSRPRPSCLRFRFGLLLIGVLSVFFILIIHGWKFTETLDYHQASTGQTVGPPKTSLYNLNSQPVETLLARRYTRNTVYMVWCGKRWFEFHHYMSLISVIKLLRPDLIKFYYNHYPKHDDSKYNTWFAELKAEHPFLEVVQLPKSVNGCLGTAAPNMTFVSTLLNQKGGMYLNEHTILVNYPPSYRMRDLIYGINHTGQPAFISAKAGSLGAGEVVSMKDKIILKITCDALTDYNKGIVHSKCVSVNKTFYPEDIWEELSRFSCLIRGLFYGSTEPVKINRSYDTLTPNIAHLVWNGGGQMKYLFYLSVLSLIYVAEVDMVYIHGNKPIEGELWGRVKGHAKVTFIFRDVPKMVYGQSVTYLSHVSDIWRADLLLKYGGIYADVDTIFVQKLDERLRAYDAVVSYDFATKVPYPNTFNMGVIVGKRNATFWHEFQKTMKVYLDNIWTYNSNRRPYQVKERRPNLVKIEPHLQVMCKHGKCHPTWWPNYHNTSIHNENTPSLKNWRTDVYAFHWLHIPPELQNEKSLLKSKGMFADIGKNVLQKAGMLGKGHG